MDIQTHRLTKKYLLKTALDSVSVIFRGGQIHALVGENGAGKSTLAALLSGNTDASSGTILLDNRQIKFNSASDALKNGIVLVHQRPMLSERLTVAENILLKVQKGFFIRKPSEELLALRDFWCPEVNISSYIKDLGGNQRFYASLLGSLLRKPQCLILDEPSAFLSPEERKVLYKNLRQLAQGGCCIIVITHSRSEALSYPDTIALLNEGKLVNQFSSRDEYKTYTESIATKSVSTGMNFSTQSASPCLSVQGLEARPQNKPILLDSNIEICYGEITAITGAKEAAIETLEDCITGMNTESQRGTALFYAKNGSKTKLRLDKGDLTAAFLRKHKGAIVPSDKAYRASNPDITVLEMLCAYTEKNTVETAEALIKKADVNIHPDEKVSSLSGGMLQRLILERELATNPDFMILCNPMHGLDIETQSKTCRKLTQAAESGTAILIIGAEDFPLTLCSKVYSLESGEIKLSFAKQGTVKQ